MILIVMMWSLLQAKPSLKVSIMTEKVSQVAKCPICKKSTEEKFRPFCSKRCADIDLGRWFDEDYTVPAVEPPDEWDLDLPESEGGEDPSGTGQGGPSSFLH
jgi:uncharacterized protein